MKKLGIVFGVATVAVLAGCKNPDYARAKGASSRNDVKTVPSVETSKPAAKPAPAETVKPCSCPPGTKHASPCKCGGADCRCEVQAPKPAPVEPEYTVYIVQSGDYLAKISKRFNVTIAALRKFNPSIKKDVVRVGQKLKMVIIFTNDSYLFCIETLRLSVAVQKFYFHFIFPFQSCPIL